MKLRYLLLLLLFCGVAFSASAQAPKRVKYQAVARDAANYLLKDQTIALRFAFEDSAANVYYQEEHSVTTNAYGIFSLNLGEGVPLVGRFDSIPWGDQTLKNLRVAMDPENDGAFSEMGLSPIMSVPYALFADRARTVDNLGAIADTSNINEIQQINLQGDTLILSGADTSYNSRVALGDLIRNLAIDTTDLDKDTLNEIQTLYLDGDSLKITGVDGGVDLSRYLQTLSLSGTNILSISGSSSTVSLPTGGGGGGGATPPQTLAFDAATNSLSISGGNNVDLSSLAAGGTFTGTDGVNITVAGTTYTFDIQDGSIDEIELTPGAVNTVLTTDGAGVVTWSPNNFLSSTLNDGNIFVGDAANTAQGVTMSGEVLITNTGVATVQPDAIESAEIVDGTIVTADLANDAVETVNILDDNVTLAKIVNGAGDEILTSDAGGNPQWETKAAFFANIPLTDGNIFVGNAGVATDVTMSGEVLITNTGVATVQPDAIESAEIVDGTIVTADLANDAVETVNILDDNVTLAKIANGAGDEILTSDATGNPQWETKAAFFANIPLTDGNIFVGNAGVATDVTMSGEVLITNTGVATVQPDAIESAEIVDGTIVTADLANDAVETVNILDDNVTLAKIANGAGDEILTSDATGNPQWETKAAFFANIPLTDGNIFVGNAGVATDVTMSGEVLITNTGVATVQPDAIESAEIVDGTIVTADLANDAVETVNILDDNVTLAKIANGAGDEILTSDATGNPQWETKAAFFANIPLTDGNIFVGNAGVATDVTMSGEVLITNTGVATVQPDAIESAEIVDGTIVTADLANDAVTTVKIVDANVTTAKIADDAVTLAKIADGTGNEVLTTTAAGVPQWEARANFASSTLTTGNIFVGVGNVATDVNMNGDVQIDATGLTTIQADAVESAEILDGTIVTADLANDAVTTVKILDANVTTAKIADDAVTLAKIADGTGNEVLTTTAAGVPQWEARANFASSTLTTGNIFVGVGNVATDVNMNGDVQIDATGLTTIQADAVESAEILDGTIVTADLANDAVTTVKILDANVTTAKIADDAVTLAKIADGTGNEVLTTTAAGVPQWEARANFASSTLTTGNIFVGVGNVATDVNMNGDVQIDATGLTTIQANAVESAEILDGTIVTADLANDAVTTVKIVDANVTTAKIADDAVTLAKIADGTGNEVLTTTAAGVPQWEARANFASSTLTTGNIFVGVGNVATDVNMNGDVQIDATGLTTIQADAVESAEILDGTIVTADLANDAVTTVKILDANVTTAKIADDAVTLAKIADGTGNEVLTTTAAGVPQWEARANFASSTLTTGNIFVGVGNVATDVNMNGDVQIDATGLTTIQANAVESAEILDGTIVTADLANDAVTTVKIVDANVTTAKIADDAVTTAKILDANVTTAKVADDAVTTAKIADGTIQTADIAAGPNNRVLITDGGGTVMWDVYGTVTSDARLKTEVATLTPSLEKLMQIRPVSYKMKDDATERKQMGVIAQEIQKLYPDVVHVDNDAEQTLSVYYTDLIAVLIKATQEQQEIILQLEEEVTALKAERDGQANQMEALNAKMETLQAQMKQQQTLTQQLLQLMGKGEESNTAED